MPAPSLQELCRKICMKNVHSFTDVGDLEYYQISDILACIRYPEKLHQIEELSPQIKGLDSELWQKFIAKEIPNWEVKNYAPKNPLKWYQVYKRYKKEQAQEIKRDEEALRETMMGIKKARDNNLSKVVDLGSLPKLPRDPRMVLNNGGVPINRSGTKRETTTSAFAMVAGSKTKMKDGKSVLIRARREAKEIAQMARLNRPTHQLSIGRVSKAPAAMVKEYRTANQPVMKILSRRTMAKISKTETTTIEDRENRLRALTSNLKSSDKIPNYIDTEDQSEENESFDESPSSPLKKQKQSHILSTAKITSNKRPSEAISAIITKSAPSIHYPTKVSDSNGTSLRSSPAARQTSRQLQAKDTHIIESEVIRVSDTSPARGDNLTVTTSCVGSPSSAKLKKRKVVEIFNRGASKRPKAP